MAAHDAVPVAIVLPVELVLEVRGDLLGGVHLLQCILGNREYLGLDVRTNVLILDDWLQFLALPHAFCLSYLKYVYKFQIC